MKYKNVFWVVSGFYLVHFFISGLLLAQLAVATENTSSALAMSNSTEYSVLDSWKEEIGVGINSQTLYFKKVRHSKSGVESTMTFTSDGQMVSQYGKEEVQKAPYSDKLHPNLRAGYKESYLKSTETDNLLNVIVWLRAQAIGLKETESLLEPEPVTLEEDPLAHLKGASPEELENRQFRLDKANSTLREARSGISGRFSVIIEYFIGDSGISEDRVVYRYKHAPAIVLKLSQAEAESISRNPLVNYLFADEKFEKELDIIGPSSMTDGVWNSGYTGSGVRIAHLESEPGKMEISNPYLMATVYRPGGAVHEHPTAIGGIIRSTHTLQKGAAYGCTLYNANAVSAANSALDAAADWAIEQGAVVINMSEGLVSSSNTALHWSDIYWDYVVHYSHVLFTKSAGNGGNEDGRITSPGRGYNSLTVGNVDGKRTRSWHDDSIHSTSSYLNPATGGNKPEISAYGSSVYSTDVGSPWIANMGTGTSYSSPLVAAFAGLCINRNPGISVFPQASKAMILVSGMAHNVEGDARMGDRDGAGCAKATAANAGVHAQVFSNTDFDANGFFEIPADISLVAGDPKRIVLVYTHPPSSEYAIPDPSSYYRSDLDLYAFIDGQQVASSTWGMQNAFEIIDYVPSVSGTMRVKIKRHSWHSSVSNLRIAVAWASKSTIGSGSDVVGLVPSNNNFVNSTVIRGASGQATGTNVRATKEPGEPNHAGNAGGKSVWWRWTAPFSGQVTMDTFGSNFDTLLAVYTGSSVGGLTHIISNDDANADDNVRRSQSRVSFNAVNGTVYGIVVDGFNGESGNIILNWSMTGQEDHSGWVGLYNPDTSTFYLKNSLSGGYADNTFNYGPAAAGWIPLNGDWNGDGIGAVALYNPFTSIFYLKNISGGGYADHTFHYGPAGAGWIPVSGDWNGDGTDGVGLYNPITSKFYLKNALAGGYADHTFHYGPAGAGWIPVSGDWNGDGTDGVGLYNPITSTFYLKNALGGGYADHTFHYGPAGAGWIPVAGDWNGDGTDRVGLYDPSASKFYLKNSFAGGYADLTFHYGPAGAGWIPLFGDQADGMMTQIAGLRVEQAHSLLTTRLTSSPQLSEIKEKRQLLGAWDNVIWNWDHATEQWTRIASDSGLRLLIEGDLDGDGVDDLIGIWSDGLYTRKSSGGKWEMLTSIIPVALAVGDMTGNGRDDLIGSWEGYGVYYLDSLSGSWHELTSVSADFLVAGDVTGDSLDNLVGVWEKSGIWLLDADCQWININESDSSALALGDINRDKQADIVANFDTGVFYLRDLSNREWTWIAETAYQLVIADIDGDGGDDLIAAGSEGVRVIYSINGKYENITSSRPDWITTVGNFQLPLITGAPDEPKGIDNNLMDLSEQYPE